MLVFRQAGDASVRSRFPTFAPIYEAVTAESRLIGVEYAIPQSIVQESSENNGLLKKSH